MKHLVVFTFPYRVVDLSPENVANSERCLFVLVLTCYPPTPNGYVASMSIS